MLVLVELCTCKWARISNLTRFQPRPVDSVSTHDHGITINVRHHFGTHHIPFYQALCRHTVLPRTMSYWGHRIFANMTFVNYWRKSRRYIGECLGGILAKCRWTFADTRDSWLEQSLRTRSDMIWSRRTRYNEKDIMKMCKLKMKQHMTHSRSTKAERQVNKTRC